MRCASRLLRSGAIWACLALSSERVRAEPKREAEKLPAAGASDNPAGAPTPVVSEGVSGAAPVVIDAPPVSQAAAQAAYQEAQARYARRDVQGALESMRESYRLCERPELLYNLATLEQELNECSLALVDYTSYLEQVPQGRYRHAADQASAQLSRACPVPPATPPNAVSAPPPPPLVRNVEPSPPVEHTVARSDSPYWTAPHVVGWSAVGAGVLAAAGAVYFTVAALSARSDYARSVNAAKTGGLDLLQPGLQDRQHRDQLVAQVLAVSGSALVAGGVLVLLFGPKDAAHAEATAQVQARPGWLGASYRQRF